jgi:hypothetical protein
MRVTIGISDYHEGNANLHDRAGPALSRVQLEGFSGPGPGALADSESRTRSPTRHGTRVTYDSESESSY